MQSPVAHRTAQCLKKFKALSETGTQEDGDRVLISDTATRFRTWSSNLGAFHPVTDPKSADYRLRESPAIVKHVSEVLDELLETLNDIGDILSGSRADQSLLDQDDDDEGRIPLLYRPEELACPSKD